MIVIGAGHAGVESAHASARLGCDTLMLTINLDNVAYMACNPSIGGSAKGHLVCEIDALGGLMGKMADDTALQVRMLNNGKGPAVHALRTQNDRIKYHKNAKKILEGLKNLTIKQGEVKNISLLSGCSATTLKRLSKSSPCEQVTSSRANLICASLKVHLTTGEEFITKSVVVACGVYLNSTIMVGEQRFDGGPSGFASSNHLSESLQKLGLRMQRFDTSTPPRIDMASVDFSKTTIQNGDENLPSFSSLTTKPIKNKISCYLTYTNPETHEIIAKDLHRSQSVENGPRYCPSIEAKIHRFPDRARHQTFLEQESLTSNDMYIQGLTTALPIDTQEKMLKTMAGLEDVKITQHGYGIEYDCIDPMQLTHALEYKKIKGLFFAGQINGTSGYEEAAAQGFVAGINAALYNRKLRLSLSTAELASLKQSSPSSDNLISDFTLSRTNSYIGVLIDDLVTQGTPEPYRMLTSRAEHRLSLRQDNADIRLTQIGRDVGLVCDKRWRIYKKKLKQIDEVKEVLKQSVSLTDIKRIFEKYDEVVPETKMTLEQCIKRPNISLRIMCEELGLLKHILPSALDYVNVETKYVGYLTKEEARIKETLRCEGTKIPHDIDYMAIKALSFEGREKLTLHRPENISSANKISGVTPADISVLLVWLRKN